MVKWNQILSNDLSTNETVRFVLGLDSGREFFRSMSSLGLGRFVRTPLRKHGVTYLRRLGRKALRRRGVLNSRNLVVKRV